MQVTVDLKKRLWTVREYNRMGELGLIGPQERVELIDGEVLRMSPQKPLQANVTMLLNHSLVSRYGETHYVRVQLPWEANPYSEPEPDFALISKDKPLSSSNHPTEADLVIEVADSSLAFDRSRKSRLYAESGVPEYWIVNIPGRCLEVYREPKDQVYSSLQKLSVEETVSPLKVPGEALLIAEFLPDNLVLCQT